MSVFTEYWETFAVSVCVCVCVCVCVACKLTRYVTQLVSGLLRRSFVHEKLRGLTVVQVLSAEACFSAQLGRLEAGWKQAGGRLEAGWRQAGGRLEVEHMEFPQWKIMVFIVF